MFTPSTVTVSAAIDEIADTIGGGSDAEFRTRALRSLAAGVKYLNGRQNWAWLLTEYQPVAVVAPFSVALTAAASASFASAATGHGVQVDDMISGSGLVLGSRVSATAASGVGFNVAMTGDAVSGTYTITRDFYALPSDWKQPYTVKLLTSPRVLWPVQRRMYDRGVVSEIPAGTPEGYDLFAGYQKSKLRLLPPPNASDVLQLRYYRRMTVPSDATASAALDIPQDYDYHLIAWAKWHFLVDKGEGRKEQAATWLQLANDGLKVMLSDQMRQPDESLAFTPGHSVGGDTWPLGARNTTWDYS